MTRVSRRHFLKASAATGALASMGSLRLLAERASATDLVTLGKSGVKVTRLAFGTGTDSGRYRPRWGRRSYAVGALRVRPRHPLLRDR